MSKIVFFSICWFGFVIGSFSLDMSDSSKPSPNKNTDADTVKIDAASVNLSTSETTKKEAVQHLPTPERVKALYVTSWTAGLTKTMSDIIKIATATEINALVIDIKDFSGIVAYETGLDKVKEYKAEQKRIRNVNHLIQRLHDYHIYVIGRIAVFQDPQLTKARPDLGVKAANGKVWKDRKGLSWVDPASREVWDYDLDIALNAVARGFDEINLDYVRFPTDGEGLNRLAYPFWDQKSRTAVIRSFFQYVRKKLGSTPISVDLFGLSVVDEGDMGIGQRIEDAYDFFDYISPMVYPSHFAHGYIGYKNPAQYPYEVIRYSMESAVRKLIRYEYKENHKNTEKADPQEKPKDLKPEVKAELKPEKSDLKATGKNKVTKGKKQVEKKIEKKAKPTIADMEKELTPEQRLKIRKKLRPWLQDFNLGAEYTIDMVLKQKQAVVDSGLPDAWMMWNPSNRYRIGIFKLSEPIAKFNNSSPKLGGG